MAGSTQNVTRISRPIRADVRIATNAATPRGKRHSRQTPTDPRTGRAGTHAQTSGRARYRPDPPTGFGHV
jgi:hypothetical protein